MKAKALWRILFYNWYSPNVYTDDTEDLDAYYHNKVLAFPLFPHIPNTHTHQSLLKYPLTEYLYSNLCLLTVYSIGKDPFYNLHRCESANQREESHIDDLHNVLCSKGQWPRCWCLVDNACMYLWIGPAARIGILVDDKYTVG